MWFVVGLLIIIVASFLSLWVITILRPDDGAELPPQQIVKVLGQDVAVYRIGQGPPLIFIHGLGASAYSWRYVIKQLSNEFSITALDLVGFGRSSKPADADYSLETQSAWLHETIQQLESGPVTLVGSSLGGLLSLWLAQQYPTVYPKVIVLAPATLGARGRPFSKHWLRFERGLRLLINRWTMPWIVYSVVGSTKTLNRRSLREYLVPGGLIPFFKAHHSLLDKRIPGAIKGLPAAVLVLWGQRDLQVSKHVMNDLKQIIPQAEWRTLPSAHHPQEHIPQVVADEIRTWLKGQAD